MGVKVVIRGRAKGKPRKPDILARDLVFDFEDEIKEVLREFEGTVATWETPVTFKVVRKAKGSVEVRTESKIYEYVDRGTKPHKIRPKRPGYPLRFNSAGFRPKTAPRQLGSSAGTPAQPPTVRAMEVNHPGTDARDFSDTIATRSQARLKRRIEKRLKEYGRS